MTNANQAAYLQLQRMVLRGDLAPGQELREVALAEATGFGRTPIREALRRLVHDGLVEVQPRRGYRVTAVTLDAVRELFEMRVLLEPAAVESAIARAGDAELEELRPLVERHYDTKNPDEYERFLSDHHELQVRLAEFGRNTRLARALRQVLEEMQRLLFVSGGSPGRDFELPHEHDHLLEAILARDAPAARQIALEQIASSRERLMRRLVGGGASPWEDVSRPG